MFQWRFLQFGFSLENDWRLLSYSVQFQSIAPLLSRLHFNAPFVHSSHLETESSFDSFVWWPPSFRLGSQNEWERSAVKDASELTNSPTSMSQFAAGFGTGIKRVDSKGIPGKESIASMNLKSRPMKWTDLCWAKRELFQKEIRNENRYIIHKKFGSTLLCVKYI